MATAAIRTESEQLCWPERKKFAFTIIDDTDGATLENVRPVYDFLADHGFCTTKTVWPLRPLSRPAAKEGTLEDAPYRNWILDLKRRGFEIALHGVADEPSTRERIIVALDRFREVIGSDPRMHVNHVGQAELMYWYAERLHGLPKLIYSGIDRWRRGDRATSLGHVRNSKYFWGDLCQERIEYVRNLAFARINTLACDAAMPYHDPHRPYVKFWFSAAEGTNAPRFEKLISERNQEQLVQERGACILYTHFAFGFVENGKLRPGVATALRRLAKLPGWFAPASTVLDHLRTRPGWRPTPEPAELRKIEWRWLAEKVRFGTK
jgi:hypothetical protein